MISLQKNRINCHVIWTHRVLVKLIATIKYHIYLSKYQNYKTINPNVVLVTVNPNGVFVTVNLNVVLVTVNPNVVLVRVNPNVVLVTINPNVVLWQLTLIL